MAKETFGERLSKLRKERELTQNDIAEKVGVTSQAVSKWENNLATPDIDILVKLSDIFGVSLDELLGKEKTTSFVNKPSKKDIDKMVFKIVIKENDCDKVNVNLPFGLLRAISAKEDGNVNILGGKNSALKNVDFNELIELVEKGAIGELVSIDNEDGTKISIWIE